MRCPFAYFRRERQIGEDISMNTIKKRTFTIIIATLMAFAMMPLVPYDAGRVFAESFAIPTAADDDTYTPEKNWEGTLEINESKTVKLIDISHINNEPGTGAAIKIAGNSTVNLVFDGENELAVSKRGTCAGIEVENGSTLNIFGIPGATLTVTGGNYSAGIGGVGYGSPSADNLPPGNINIYSGIITAIGGSKGAGIGSGQHSSASDINICGGEITALGTGGGAGIGSGYGTSGGVGDAAKKVGFYNGGNITISGGEVFAAGDHINKDNLDIYNTDTLYVEGSYGTFAAGIGGGYGASSGNIVIKGDAEVTAIGSCGGAGIGTGRGTSTTDKYNHEKFDCNVTISENAKVNALATDDRRQDINGDDGAAAIGLGRGCTIENDPKGIVTITGNAEVYAVGSSNAAAIGGSSVVGRYEDDLFIRPADAHLKTLKIGDNATVTAVSDGFRPAVDLEPSGFVSISADDQYFENRGDFYTGDVFPLKLDAVNAGSTSAETTFAMQGPHALNVMVHVPGIDKYSFIVKDYQGEEGERIYLSNAVEDNSAQFMSGSAYDLYGLTARLDRSTSVDTQYGNIGVSVKAAEGIFEYGSSFVAGPAEDGAAAKLDKTYSDKLSKVLFFDAGVMDPSEEMYTEYRGGKPEITVQLPKGWDKSKTQAVLVKNGTDEPLSGLSFKVTRGGTFALLEQKANAPAPAKISGTLLAKATAKGKTGLTISWDKVKGVSGYDIFFARCNHGDKITGCKLVKTIESSDTLSWTKTSLKKKRAYKAYVKAFVMQGGKKKYVSTSPLIHAYTGNSTKKYTNARSVSVNKTKVSLKKGKTFKIKAKVAKVKKNKKLMPKRHVATLRYKTSDSKVATVSKSGKITAKGKGTCIVYVYAHNGVKKAVTVTVR